MPYLEHLGIAVADPAAVIQLYETLLGNQPYKAEPVEREGVQTHFISAGSAKLELLEALGPDSPVARYLEKRGEGLHHLAFEVEDIDAQLHRLRDLGFTPLSDEPRPGADGKRIFFLHPRQTHGVLIEFCQRTPRPLPPTLVPYRDAHLAVYERGRPDRPPLILLHDLAGATMLETEALAPQLESHFHVLALDFAGHGGSAPYDDVPLTLDFLAENVRGVIDFFDADRVHLFGFSLGGLVALHVAARHPDRIDRVAVHGVNTDWIPQRIQATLDRLDAEMTKRRDPDHAHRLAEHHDDWRALFARAQLMISTLPSQHPAPNAWHDVRHPVLVSAVDRDADLPLALSLSLHRALPQSTLAVLPGSRHALDALDATLYGRLLVRHFEM